MLQMMVVLSSFFSSTNMISTAGSRGFLNLSVLSGLIIIIIAIYFRWLFLEVSVFVHKLLGE